MLLTTKDIRAYWQTLFKSGNGSILIKPDKIEASDFEKLMLIEAQ